MVTSCGGKQIPLIVVINKIDGNGLEDCEIIEIIQQCEENSLRILREEKMEGHPMRYM